MSNEHIKWVHKPEDNQFEVQTEGYFGMIEYEMIGDDKIDLYHTEVDPELEGKGVARVLVRQSLEYVKSRNLKFIATCGYVAAFVQRNPEWQDLQTEA